MVKYQPFRFWCQKVLPLVYDDSLSYYELLCKVVGYLNNLITDTNQLITEYEELKNMIENFDFQDEVNKKLDEMAEDGTLDALVTSAANSSFESLRRKILPITGELRQLANDDRVIHNRVYSIRNYYDDPENPETVTRKSIVFARGQATYTVNFNKLLKQRFGFILQIRGYSLNENYLYGPYDETENEEWLVFANGRPIDPFDLQVNDEFVDMLIYKKQDTGKYLITHFDTSGIHIYYYYPEIIDNTGNIPRIRPYNVGTFNTIMRENGIELQTPPTGTAIMTTGPAAFAANTWFKLDITL